MIKGLFTDKYHVTVNNDSDSCDISLISQGESGPPRGSPALPSMVPQACSAVLPSYSVSTVLAQVYLHRTNLQDKFQLCAPCIHQVCVCVRVCVLQRYRAAFGCVLRHCWFDPFFVGCTLLDGTDLVSVSGIRICCHSTVQAVTCRHVMDIYQTADKVFFKKHIQILSCC